MYPMKGANLPPNNVMPLGMQTVDSTGAISMSEDTPKIHAEARRLDTFGAASQQVINGFHSQTDGNTVQLINQITSLMSSVMASLNQLTPQFRPNSKQLTAAPQPQNMFGANSIAQRMLSLVSNDPSLQDLANQLIGVDPQSPEAQKLEAQLSKAMTAAGLPTKTIQQFFTLNASRTVNASGIQTPKLSALQQSLQNISSSGVDQGQYGDCVFEASLTSLASTPTGQAQLSKMITENSDGSYKVVFPGDSSHPVTVTQDDLSKLGTQDSALWAKIIETAFVKAYPELSKGNYPGQLPNGQSATPAQYALNLLSGSPATKTTASDSNIDSVLDTAINKNHQSVVVCCTDDDQKALVSGHEWTVVEYNHNTKTVIVRNPWGSSTLKEGENKNGISALADGKMQMSLSTFSKYYGEVTIV